MLPKNHISHPIPPHNIQNLLIMFQEATNLNIQSLTQLLCNPHLPANEWDNAQDRSQDIINTLSTCIESTCINSCAPPTLSHQAHQQGGFFPCQQKKAWIQQLKVYHSIRKAVKDISTQPSSTWTSHHDMQTSLHFPTKPQHSPHPH